MPVPDTTEPDTTEPRSLRIDVVSDVICPWCFIGKRRLQAALQLVPEIAIDLNWQPFQLDATLAAEGKDRSRYLNEKFGGPDRVAEIHARIAQAGRDVGIPFAFEKIDRSPNTLDAHRLILWAAAGNRQSDVVERLFSAFFIEGRDLTRPQTLVEIGANAGMDRDSLAEALASDADRDTVGAAIAQAHAAGINSVPTFIIDSRYSIVGAHPADVLAGALRDVAAKSSAPAD